MYSHHQVFFNDHEKERWYELQQILQTASRNVNSDRACFGRKTLPAISSSDRVLMKHTAELLNIPVPNPVRVYTCSGYLSSQMIESIAHLTVVGVTNNDTRLHLKDCFKFTSPLTDGEFYARLHVV